MKEIKRFQTVAHTRTPMHPPFQLYNAVSPWFQVRWLRGTVVERWSLTGDLSLSCARPAADG